MHPLRILPAALVAITAGTLVLAHQETAPVAHHAPRFIGDCREEDGSGSTLPCVWNRDRWQDTPASAYVVVRVSDEAVAYAYADGHTAIEYLKTLP